MELELRDDFVKILGKSVVAVARGRLAGFPESPTVIGDYAMTRGQKRGGLLLLGCAVQWIPVDQNDRSTRTVVLIIQIDIAGVFLPDGYVWHCGSFLCAWALTNVGCLRGRSRLSLVSNT